MSEADKSASAGIFTIFLFLMFSWRRRLAESLAQQEMEASLHTQEVMREDTVQLRLAISSLKQSYQERHEFCRQSPLPQQKVRVLN